MIIRILNDSNFDEKKKVFSDFFMNGCELGQLTYQNMAETLYKILHMGLLVTEL